jgi:hypothetical protein
MIHLSDVLEMLRPNGGYIVYGEDFDSIQYIGDIKPVTKKEIEQGFKDFETWKAKQQSDKEAAKKAILDRIGLTVDEVKMILG